jgi:predicted MFS family arabinose efflux permease
VIDVNLCGIAVAHDIGHGRSPSANQERQRMFRSRRGHTLALVCASQFFVFLGVNFWVALMPQITRIWSLTNTQAGFITGTTLAAYTISVPVLLALTDHFDARSIYVGGAFLTALGYCLFAFAAYDTRSAIAIRIINGVGEAGTFMVGVRIISDRINKDRVSRAVALHTASIGISTALSFVCADVLSNISSWKGAFWIAGMSAATGAALVATLIPRMVVKSDKPAGGYKVREAAAVILNRSAMAYALAYSIHAFENVALRSWAVTFLTFVAIDHSVAEPFPSPTFVLFTVGLMATVAGIVGNEAAIYLGRRRLIVIAITLSMIFATFVGLVGPMSYTVAVGLIIIYGFFVMLDSSSLTVGTAGTADPSRQGATLAVHSMLGYGGGFMGPLAIGLVLDFHGGISRVAWTWAYVLVAFVDFVALVQFWSMYIRGVAGDRDEK